jgi:hypothetical protein
MHNIRTWPLCTNLTPLRIQTANLVHVTTIKRSDPNQSFAVRVMNQHPSADQTGKTTYDIDVLLAEDDDIADVCWRFQVAEGEDVLDRLLAFAQALGKDGSGDEDYDEYVRAFQGKVTGLAVRRICDKEELVVREEDEYGDVEEIGEVKEDVISLGLEEKMRDGDIMDEKSRNKGKEK